MAGQRVNRLRRAVLTGTLAPVLILGAAGFGVLPGGILPTGVTAQSVIDGGSCTAFGAPETAQATEMSVADVAEKVNPAVVTIVNLQPISQADFGGISGIDGIPEIPGSGGTKRGRMPVTVVARWNGRGPRNVLIERRDGSRTVRPFRGLRRSPVRERA